MVWGRCCCIHRGHGCVVRVPVEAVQGGCCALSVAPKSVRICGCLGGMMGLGSALSGWAWEGIWASWKWGAAGGLGMSM